MREESDHYQEPRSSFGVFAAFAALAFIGTLIPSAPWGMQLSLFTGAIGLMACLSPGRRLSVRFLIPILLCVLAAFACFLPAAWLPTPAWRTQLEAAGLDTGPLGVVQWQHSLEQYAPLLLVLFAAVWFAGHRVDGGHLRFLALGVPIAVVVFILLYLILSRTGQLPESISRKSHFGFFPNRNHASTLLSMGALTALGSALQALRDKKTGRCLLSVSLALFILWTQFSHSVSRSGILLSVIGPCLWAGLLGWKYFGRNERRVIGLLLLLAIGTFALTESRVKSRLDATAEKVAELSENSENEESTSSAPIDFRVPIMQDTFTMISAAPLTGVGAGQFRYVFPQFREKSVLGWYRVVLHPESNWLEWAAECGVPATLGIAILLGIAYFQAARRIRQNRDRALRAACLAASALLPLHGLVDVPAHVLGLCFVSILLFALSQAPRSRKEAPLPRSWGFRPVGVLLLPASLALTGLLPGIPKPLTVRAPLAYRQTLQDLGVQGFPPKTYSSISALLEERQALASRSQSYTQALPLDPRWHHLYALCLLSFENQWGTADRQFSYERLLFPTMIQPVFHQADAWIPYDTHRSLTLWSEAVDRAHAIDSKSVARSPRLARTLAIFAIRKHRLRHPELRAEIDRLIQFLR